MQGFSVSNLQRMKKFATLYPNLSITAQAVPQLPWGHIVRLMQMIKNDAEREWYAQQTIKNGWSRAVLEMQIERKGSMWSESIDFKLLFIPIKNK